MLMRKISKAEDGDTDTTRDFEYTDWDALRVFVASFIRAKVHQTVRKI